MTIEVEIAGTGQIAEFPDGTSPDVIRQALSRFQTGGQDVAVTGVPAPAIDAQIQSGIDAAGPVAAAPGGGGVQDVLGGVGNAALEIIAGLNRGVISVADIPADVINAALELGGADARVPTIAGTEFGQAGTAGGFVEDPTARQVLGTLGEFVAPGPPIAALAKRGDDVGGIAQDFTRVFTEQSPAKQKIAEKLAADPANKKLVKFINDGTGRIKKDKVAIEAINQGFDEGVIAAVKGSKPRDKRRMRQMVDILKRGQENALFAAKNRPSDVAGKSLLERVNHIKTVNKESGQAIDRVARTLRGEQVDISAPVDQFSAQLENFGVRLVDDGKGGLKPNFEGSVLSPGDRGPVKEVIRQMSRIGRQGEPDALSAHQMKRIIDNNVTFGKVKTGLSGDTERAMKEFRAGLDNVLDANFPAYNKANTDYAETIGALDSLQQAAGTKLDLFGPNADKAIGTSLRRLLSNAQSRVTFIDAIDEMETVAKNTGKTFDDDVLSQVLFADELDSVFGAAARTSLKGQQAQALETGVQAARRGVTEVAGDIAVGAARRLQGINEENAIKSIENLLKR